MEKQDLEQKRYLLAKSRVEQLGKFYRHLSIYLVVNLFLSSYFILNDINDGETFLEAASSYGNYKVAVLWGIGLTIHAINTFATNLFFSKDWEQRKLEEYLKK